ncbi:putative sulfate exporter family transporter [Clostridium niameyense]|uniref:Putative sulfate exporter family transporter n=1 Tax=Clostridium niameyense TaxID=1622073 RepID=A0A6M0R7H2_9CLOT|nr:putative sulfate exporter family transporter [Clostridium niameyense]NEZ46186.1 putative sulfate exporter family transporter [Clostridium niameyense]
MCNSLKKIKEIIPGLIICIIIAYTGKFLGKFIPTIGGATLAIFLGMLVGNTFGNKKSYAKGSKFAESDLLSYSIVLLGGTLSAQTILKLGISGVGFIIIQMCITVTFALFLGKKLGFSQNFRYLMASGNAVCGSSAIASTAPVIDASDDDKVISITMVNLTGTILMILLPLIAKIAFSTEVIKTSALLGGILQSVGQVVASGSMISESVKDLATIFKIVRIIFLVFVVIILGNLKKRSMENEEYNISKKSKIKIPWYVIGFFMTCTLFTLNIIPLSISKVMKNISNNFEIIALAGIGMRVNFKELIKQGVKASIYSLSIALVQIISALTLITILF